MCEEIKKGLLGIVVDETTLSQVVPELSALTYRGYTVQELCDKCDIEEVAYLVLNGELPNRVQLKKFIKQERSERKLSKQVLSDIKKMPRNAHPMGILASMVCSLSTFYPESQDPNRPQQAVDLTIQRLLAKLPTLAAWSFKHSMSHPYVYPKNEYGYCENFLNMMFSMPTEEYDPDPVIVSALNKLLILHADHEQNCSASTVRIVGSSQANLYASISAGVSALWGPLHGGANQAVIEMLENIRQDGGDLDKWIAKAKDKDDPFRLMGFGHRVYKNFDPRATIIKKACDDVLDKLGIDDPVLDIAKKLEKVALEDNYFVQRGLYPNVDFYSGIIYRALGIPTEMFTVMFALGRLPGWIAQWKEMIENGEPIGRPRQIYTGNTKRDYINLENR